MAAGGQRRAGEGEVYDVRVIAFAGGAAHTLQGLQQVFGLDRVAAQRLLDSVPVVVKHAAPANEAQSYLQLLRGIGAEVQLESTGAAGVPPALPAQRAGGGAPPPPPLALRRPAAAPPKTAKGPPPPPAASAADRRRPPASTSDDALPRPIVRTPTQDLEFDLASPAPLPAPRRDEGNDSAPSQDESGDAAGVARRARNEFDFESSTGGVRLELDAGAEAASMRTRTRAPTPASGARVLTTAPQRTQSSTASSQSATLAERVAGPPMSRAAVVEHSGPAERDPRARSFALLRVLAALAIGGGGILLHHSIFYGNANLLGVLVHAVAIYQLGIGLRSLRS